MIGIYIGGQRKDDRAENKELVQRLCTNNSIVQVSFILDDGEVL